jgi:hypothetical protein
MKNLVELYSIALSTEEYSHKVNMKNTILVQKIYYLINLIFICKFQNNLIKDLAMFQRKETILILKSVLISLV